jgi:hypothetical protein
MPIASQNWHRDGEDRQVLKIFIYLNDVDEETGPFMYVKESIKGLKYGKLFPQRPPEGSYPNESVDKAVSPEDIKLCLGKAGTVIFCDTTGLHRGGYAFSKERTMFTASYQASSSVALLPRCRVSADFRPDDPVVRFAVTYPKGGLVKKLAKKYFKLAKIT